MPGPAKAEAPRPMRTPWEIEHKRVEIENALDISGEDKRIANAVFRWMLGDDESLEEIKTP
jgi:hypothetical protein